MVIYLGSLVQSCCGREEHCKPITLACVGSAGSIWATLGLPLLTACVLSWSTLLRLQVALQGNCLRWALCWVHYPGLSPSGSASQVLHKGTDSTGRFVPFPGSRSSGDQVLGNTLSPGGRCFLSPPPSKLLSFKGAQQKSSQVCPMSPLGS